MKFNYRDFLDSKLSINSNGVPIFTAAQMATTGLTIHNGTTGTAVQIGTYDAGSYNYIQSSYVNSASTARELRFYNGSINSLKLDTSGDANFAGKINAVERILTEGENIWIIHLKLCLMHIKLLPLKSHGIKKTMPILWKWVQENQKYSSIICLCCMIMAI